ncbi:MAG: carbohydrate ABC transporter permease [Defluviitaleaceae bacterium]|nr:carbohydrate ABC transporter permease [Defluviitaleaceae bacterium]
MRRLRVARNVIKHVVVLVIGFVMIYPLAWMFISSLTQNQYIFHDPSFFPSTVYLRNYTEGWQGVGGRQTFATFFWNSFFYAGLATVGVVISSSAIAYSFSRGRYRGRKVLFAILIGTLLLPAQVLMVPTYLWFHWLGWVGSYLPLIVPTFFGGAFFIFLITNFMNAIPRELDEAAKIDGCSFYGIYGRIMMPLAVPALVTAGLFSFIWRWDDFLGPLLYIQRAAQFPVSLALRVFADPTTITDWGAFFAMSTLSLVPAVLIFIFFQKYLVEGISTTGLKG